MEIYKERKKKKKKKDKKKEMSMMNYYLPPVLECQFFSACFRGWQTGQSFRVQFFQWPIIVRDELQCGTGQFLSALHVDMWFSTFFMVLQWSRLHCHCSPFVWFSRRWQLCACKNSSSCCWISLRFSGSAVTGRPPLIVREKKDIFMFVIVVKIFLRSLNL